MIPSSIERDILIEAPVEVVWRAVTEPDQISSWWSDAAEYDLAAGSQGILTWTDRATNNSAVVPITIQTIEPPHTFIFRWVYPEGETAREGNSLLVEFTLMPEGDATRLRVIETGWSTIDWPEEQTARELELHAKGWESHLANLPPYLARQRRNEPAASR